MLLPFTDGGFKQIAVILIHKQIMQKLCFEGCRDRFRAYGMEEEDEEGRETEELW